MAMGKIHMLSVLLLFWGLSAFAQPNLVQHKEYESFKTVNVSDKFTVRLRSAPDYSVKITSDERISPYVQAYVKNGTLYLVLDEKNYTPELKKQLRHKGAAEPVLEAEVYMPTLSAMVLNDKAVLSHCDRFHASTFALTVSDNAKVAQFRLDCSTAELDFAKSAWASVEVNSSEKLYVHALNSSDVTLMQNGGVVFVDASGSSSVKVKGSMAEADVYAANSSEVTMMGTASVLKVKAAGVSRTDAEQLEAREGDIEQTGASKCHVNVTDHLKVSLTGGSMLTFKRKPAIEVDRIVGSTLIKADDPKRK